MSNPTFSDEDFFDEDGNLKATSWQLRDQQRQKEEEERSQKEEDEKSLRDANRRFAIDNRVADFEKSLTETQHKRRVREEWMRLPEWIRKMKRVPLSAPPTEGKKQKMLYSLTGRVTLTDDERNRREKALSRVKLAIHDYETIHRPFPANTPMVPVAVIPVAHGIGGTIISRAISRVLVENRMEYGTSAVIDLGSSGNRLPQWYERTDRTSMVLKFILNHIRSGESMRKMSEIFRIGEEGEYFVYNHPSPERRVDPDIKDVADLYRFVRSENGVVVFDCDANDQDSLIAAVALARTRIFVLPLSADAPEMLMKTLENIRLTINDDERYAKIVDSSILVISGLTEATGNAKGHAILKNILSSSAAKAGISIDRTMIIPFDPELSSPPMHWYKLKFATSHAFRKLTGMIISDVIGKLRPEDSMEHRLKGNL